MTDLILQVAVPYPLYRQFDYLAPAGQATAAQPGQRILVPFGRRHIVGIVVGVCQHSEVPHSQLKQALRILDPEPLLPPDVLELVHWSAAYYAHPVGEVFATALPVLLRQEKALPKLEEWRWLLTPTGHAALATLSGRAVRQRRMLELLRDHPLGMTPAQLRAADADWRTILQRLQEFGWVERRQADPTSISPRDPVTGESPPPLAATQQAAVSAILERQGFSSFLLDGVTGSGKTEVYLRIIERMLAQNRQVLILVPEIGLAPQLSQRLRARFSAPMAIMHSGLNESERLDAWLRARSGRVQIIVGTRSAIFVPLLKPGLIIVDEEHDPSFKQQEGMHYSARDLAVWRARRLDIPVVLGSATPSLETLHNAQMGRYIHLQLPQRVGSSQLPRLQVIDMRPLPSQTVLAPQLHQAITHHLAAGGQVLLFRNRRGWAPLLRCHHCGWIAACPRCDARYTLHPGHQRRPHGELICHHCGNRHPAPQRCPSCQQDTLISVGFGTIRLEDHLQALFPDVRIARLDRDSTQHKHALETLLDDIAKQRMQILVGTQILAKGHHFPGVSLVGVVDADQGFFSSDFRAGERMAQLLVQVAGRAGRADRPGEVLIQTHLPEHPMLQALITQGYPYYAQVALAERAHAQWPPYTRLALLRAHAHQIESPLQFLQAAKTTAQMLKSDEISLYGPVPAPMPRRAGRHHAQLLIQCAHFAPLHQLLQEWIPMLAQLVEARQVRWSIDVDPGELF